MQEPLRESHSVLSESNIYPSYQDIYQTSVLLEVYITKQTKKVYIKSLHNYTPEAIIWQ